MGSSPPLRLPDTKIQSLNKRHYKIRKHWKRLWINQPERMKRALVRNREVLYQNYRSVVEGWKVDLAQLPFPMSSKDFNRLVKVWVTQSVKGRTRRGYQPKSLKAYFLRHNLLTFDGVKRTWNVPTCEVGKSQAKIDLDCPTTTNNQSDSSQPGTSGG